MTTELIESYVPTLDKEIFESLRKMNWIDPDGPVIYAGEGQEAIVWHLAKQSFTMRVPKNLGDIEKMNRQRRNQEDFFYGVIEGNQIGKIPDYFRVPIIWNDASIQTGLPSGIIVMQTINGKTLLNHMIILKIKEQYGYEVSSSIDPTLSDRELIEIYFSGNKKIFMDMFWQDCLEMLFGKEVRDAIEGSIRFLERSGLEHGDLHIGNFMLEKTTSGKYIIYLIDFGKAEVGYKATPIIYQGRKSYIDKYSGIWEGKGISLVS